jgi:CHAD domain-containing protein
MVSKKRIRTYYAKRWKKLSKNFRAVQQSPDSDSVHDLRVETKKLRAVAALLNQTNGRAGNLSIKQMKPLIRQTGAIREAELHLKTLYECEFGMNGLEKEQKDCIKNGYAIIHSKGNNFKAGIKAVKKKFTKPVHALKNKEVRNYVDSLVDQLIFHFLWPIDTEQLHESRTKIKNLIYIVDLLPKKLQKKININIKYLDQLQELIGQWHDLNLTLHLLLSKKLDKGPVYTMMKANETALLEQVKKEAEYFASKVIVSNNARHSDMPANNIPGK